MLLVRRGHAARSLLQARSFSEFRSLLNVDKNTLIAELHLRGLQTSPDDTVSEMRERLRAVTPGFMPGAWPRRVRSLASDLGLVIKTDRVLPRQFFATPVSSDGLAALVSQASSESGVAQKPVLVAANDPHNPVRQWPAAKEWANPEAFFARFQRETIQLRPVVAMTAEGGSGVREPGPVRKPPRKTQFSDIRSALAPVRPESGSGAGNAAVRSGSQSEFARGPMNQMGDFGVGGSEFLIGFSTARDGLYRAIRRDVPLAPAANAQGTLDDVSQESKRQELCAGLQVESSTDENGSAFASSSETMSEENDEVDDRVGDVEASEVHSSAVPSGVPSDERARLAASTAALRSLSMHPVLSVSGRGGGVGFHRHDSSWMALFSGLKLWCFSPPTKPPRSAHKRCSVAGLLRDPDVTVCVQRPGDLVVVPRGWWHATYNLATDQEDSSERDDPAKCIAVGFGGLAPSPALHWHAAEGRKEALINAWQQIHAVVAANTSPVNFPKPGQQQAVRSDDSCMDDDMANKETVPSSRFVGVSWDATSSLWKSSVLVDGKIISLGSCVDEEMAARKYDDYVTRHVNPPIVDPLADKLETGKTLMHTAAYHGQLAVCKWLGEQAAVQARHDALTAAAVGSGVAPDERALDAVARAAVVASVNATCVLRATPLHAAAAQGHPDTCVWLMERGAHPRQSSGLGETPISLAKLAADSSPLHRKTLSALSSYCLL